MPATLKALKDMGFTLKILSSADHAYIGEALKIYATQFGEEPDQFSKVLSTRDYIAEGYSKFEVFPVVAGLAAEEGKRAVFIDDARLYFEGSADFGFVNVPPEMQHREANEANGERVDESSSTVEARNSDPESRYDPRLFMLMANGHQHFDEQLPPIVHDIAYMGDDLLTCSELEGMKAKMKELKNSGPKIIFNAVYASFARERGWVVDGEGIFRGFQVCQERGTLTEEQEEEWKKYRLVGEVPRDIAMSALSDLITIFSELPSTKRAMGLEDIGRQLREVPFELAVKFFPDLTDVEARKLFSRSAEEVKSIAQAGKEDAIQ